MDLDTGLLRALAELDAVGSFAGAADELHLTQQALSKRIAKLELIVGEQLVDRTDRRRIRLTPAGAELLEPARRILAEVDALLGAASPAPLRVDPLEATLTPIQWLRAAQQHGVTLVAAYRATKGSAAQAVRSEAADLSFGRVTAEDLPWVAGVRRRLVMLEQLCLLTSDDSPLAAEEELPLARLRDQQLWFPMEGAPREWRDLVTEFVELTGARVDAEGSLLGYDYWLDRVAAGEAPPSLVGSEMPIAPGLRAVPLVDPTPVYPWWAMWRPGTDPGPVLGFTPLGGLATVPSSLIDPDATWMPATDRAALAAAPGTR